VLTLQGLLIDLANFKKKVSFKMI